MVISIDSSVLVAYYDAKAGVPNTTATTASSAAAAAGPTYSGAAPTESVLTSAVLAGGAFVNPFSVHLTPTAASPVTSDDKNLFAVYQGLTALQGLAQQASATGVSSTQQTSLATTFARGLAEVQSFLGAQPFKSLTVADGAVSASLSSKAGVASSPTAYTTATIATGSSADVVPALTGPLQFSASVTAATGATTSVAFDLDDMGSTPRTLDNVINYLNGRLSDAGATTRFGFVRTPALAQTSQPDSQAITGTPDSLALRVTNGPGESVSFSAPTTTPAVYVAQTSGTPVATSADEAATGGVQGGAADATQTLVKLDGAPAAANAAAVFGDTLPPGVASVQATATGTDGSLYVLANLSGSAPGGQAIKGSSDVALLKYDSAGNLAYARTLGATAAAGTSLALSADGTQIAIAGSVTGALSGSDPADLGAPADPSAPSGFVAVYSASRGDEQWTQRTANGPAAGVAFDAGGAVYVASDTAASASTLQQGYLQSFTSSTQTAFDGTVTTSVSASDAVTIGASGAAVGGVVTTADGGVIAASVDNGHAILSRFDGPLTAGATPTAVRDLGDLGGGGLAGVALAADGSVVVAGSTDGSGLSAGAVSGSYTGGQQAFVAKVSADLTAAATDRLSYLDTGAGDATTSALAVSGGQVYVTGAVAGAAAASDGADVQTGFVQSIDLATGTVGWANTLTGAGGRSAPSAIAVAATGTSALDRLGLPHGAIDAPADQTLVATTSVRAGDSFSVRTGGGAPQTITISADDTLTTLAAKVTTALDYEGAATATAPYGAPSVLQITPTSFQSVELASGPAGADALVSLGLTPGLVTSKAKPTAAQKASSNTATPYALNLGSSLEISTTLGAKAAQGALTKALATVQQAYADMNSPLKSSTAAASAPVSAYLSAQLADYQLALSRLSDYTSGSSSASSGDTGGIDLSSLYS